MLKLKNVRLPQKNSKLGRYFSLEYYVDMVWNSVHHEAPTDYLGFPDVHTLDYFLDDSGVSGRGFLSSFFRNTKLLFQNRDGGKSFTKNVISILMNTPDYSTPLEVLNIEFRGMTFLQPGRRTIIDGCRYEEMIPVRMKYFK